ncbi:pimeloyl-ACP methyl ester carboxylesterase [Arcticibacter pallidicorallinus]|uniref:Pimeloyl-ACP methyl ester carboxylesterase n=1 Tax=Arcticibacter pallidicorallinus TaxID=1259464 RepID=A0A2T0U4C8_9SPHI|nr:alpha/beta hydrolase [Arcticibacter pallidicorallinus]PRY52771.1 pimeloyl-ACP methyl ester carboxylesterase [Arcticibacter pallidicorallinus]
MFGFKNIAKTLITTISLFGFLNAFSQVSPDIKPTICLLGGTPSSAKIVDEIPEDLKAKYNFISFNRPGFGDTPNKTWNEEDLFDLASKAGLKSGDFGVIGVSGGGPLAILIAQRFKLKYCGVISGMVPSKDYFPFADSTFTKPLMISVLRGFDDFKKTIEEFPNVNEILKQADSPAPIAIRACFDDLHFILRGTTFSNHTYDQMKVNWIHGENDKNVALKSAQSFLAKFKNSKLTVIPGAAHSIDARLLVRQLADQWD